jgi:hypothetical protein
MRISQARSSFPPKLQSRENATDFKTISFDANINSAAKQKKNLKGHKPVSGEGGWEKEKKSGKMKSNRLQRYCKYSRREKRKNHGRRQAIIGLWTGTKQKKKDKSRSTSPMADERVAATTLNDDGGRQCRIESTEPKTLLSRASGTGARGRRERCS